MVSWSFVIIATEEKKTGSGQTILDAANYLVAASSNSASWCFNKLNVGQIGAFGASQGAAGAINALMKSNGSIKTVIPIELLAQVWCFLNCVDTKNLMQGSVFFVGGSLEPISPPTQSAQTTRKQSIEAYYSAVSGVVGKVKGTLGGPTHNDVTDQPDCKLAEVPCGNGVYGYLVDPTAWMMCQL